MQAYRAVCWTSIWTWSNSPNTGKNKVGLVLSISLLKFACISNRETELNEPQYSKPGHRRVLSPQPSCFYFLIGLTSKHYGAQPFTISFKLNTGSPSKHLPRWAFSENKNWLPELSRRISDKAPHFLKCSQHFAAKKIEIYFSEKSRYSYTN